VERKSRKVGHTLINYSLFIQTSQSVASTTNPVLLTSLLTSQMSLRILQIRQDPTAIKPSLKNMDVRAKEIMVVDANHQNRGAEDMQTPMTDQIKLRAKAHLSVSLHP
jgi:hypothetical protein